MRNPRKNNAKKNRKKKIEMQKFTVVSFLQFLYLVQKDATEDEKNRIKQLATHLKDLFKIDSDYLEEIQKRKSLEASLEIFKSIVVKSKLLDFMVDESDPLEEMISKTFYGAVDYCHVHKKFHRLRLRDLADGLKDIGEFDVTKKDYNKAAKSYYSALAINKYKADFYMARVRSIKEILANLRKRFE